MKKLTRRQVRDLFLTPAVKLAAEARGESAAPAGIPMDQQTRQGFVLGMVAQFGGDPAKWAADYDRMQAEIAASGG